MEFKVLDLLSTELHGFSLSLTQKTLLTESETFATVTRCRKKKEKKQERKKTHQPSMGTS